MEAQSLVSEQERLHDAAIFTRGYMSALGDRDDNHLSSSELRATAKIVERILAICADVRSTFRSVANRSPKGNEESRRNSLAATTKALDGLKDLIKIFHETLQRYPEIGTYWNHDARQAVEETLELFEEAQETLAIGLSSSFQSEIDDARKEAGIDTNGKPPLPTR